MTLPEALRLAPNLQVAQVNAHDWAISARGFNNTLANKLLVMIDGRTVYTPLDAGVFWDAQFVPLNDVDRIEVVSGPGATLWGANAVNGVINVVTRSARDTPGLVVSGAGGSFLQDFGSVRYGGAAGTNLFYRVYGQRYDHNASELPNGSSAHDSWDMTQGGFRMDYYPGTMDHVTLQGDVYSGSEGLAVTAISTNGLPAQTTIDGQNVLGRWSRAFSDDSDFTVQLYFDRTWRNVPNSFAEDLKTYDIDFQHHFPLGGWNAVTWGGGYRVMADDVHNTAALAFIPAHRNLQLFSAFVQDDITVVPDRLHFIPGTKVEHNDFSGFEVEPSVRLVWTPDEHQTIWAAVSRSVRTPSRIDEDFRVPGSGPPFLLVGATNFEAESEIAYEIGYRVNPIDRLVLSISAFYNSYDHLRSVNSNGPAFFIANDFRGQTEGVELSENFKATSFWRLRGGYTYLFKTLWTDHRPNVLASAREGNDPQNQFVLQSLLDLPAHFECDLVARYVDTLPKPNVPGYFTFDARLAWHCRNLEIAVVGQNLWDRRHPEFGTAGAREEIPRSVYGKVTLRF
jgi:iron complex outermembrane receptor protein